MSDENPTPEELEEWARVRGYILAQADRYTPSQYWPRLVEQRAKLLQLFQEATPAQAAWRPPTGEGEEAWSIVEVAQHVLQWTENIIELNHAFLEGREGRKLPSGYLDPDPAAQLPAVLEQLVESSHELAETLLYVAGRADPAHTTEHPRFGELNARQWFILGRVHDMDHIRQIEGLKQMEGFPA
ncbi:MAG: DinB family protein [Dehalococcoidia bacterium]